MSVQGTESREVPVQGTESREVSDLKPNERNGRQILFQIEEEGVEEGAVSTEAGGSDLYLGMDLRLDP